MRKPPSSATHVPRPSLCEREIFLCFLLLTLAVIEMKFETGDEKLKDLELGMFVGAGRFVVEKGKPVVVEYKVSKMVKGA